ncbi:MAG: hypothetical protein EXS14_07685 [Planctomycetes bacterium]|nr:hypothetical protein [Planctomycetota bacterium]
MKANQVRETLTKLAGVSDLVVDSTATVTFKAKEKAPTKEDIGTAFKVLKWEPAVHTYASVERLKPKGGFDIVIDGVG